MYSEIHSDRFEAHAQEPRLLKLLERYLEIRGSRDMPDAPELPLSSLSEDAPFLMQLSLLETGAYRYDHYGAGIAAAAGIDMTGRSTAEFGGSVGAFFHAVYSRAAEEARPLFTIHRAVIATAVHTWERLILPLRQPDGSTGFLVYNRPRQFQMDFLKAVLEILPDAILALRAVRDDTGEVADIAIVSANPQALKLFGLQSAADIDDVGMRQCSAKCGSDGLWIACAAAIVRRERIATEMVMTALQRPRRYSVDVLPLLDGAVLRIADITEIVMSAGSPPQ